MGNNSNYKSEWHKAQRFNCKLLAACTVVRTAQFRLKIHFKNTKTKLTLSFYHTGK